jgi:DNA-directed RNA polymerase specialized sigma24 family protein
MQSMWDEADSAAIVASMKDPERFGVLFDRHATAVFRYLVRRVGMDEADPLLGEVFRVAFERRASFDLERPDARPWLYGIATNLLREDARREGRQMRAYAGGGCGGAEPGGPGHAAAVRADRSGLRARSRGHRCARGGPRAARHAGVRARRAVQPSPAAAAVLRRAADAALASPPAHLRAREYWYEEYHATYLNMVASRKGTVYAYVPQVMRYWIGSRRWIRRDTRGRVRPTQPITQAWQRRALRDFIANPSLDGRGAGYDLPITNAQMLRAPGSTAGLRRWVLAEVAPGFTPKPQYRARIMFTAISDLLIEPMVPARLQAGLYRVAATIPGIQMLGCAATRSGGWGSRSGSRAAAAP